MKFTATQTWRTRTPFGMGGKPKAMGGLNWDTAAGVHQTAVLITMMMRFHALTGNQPINQAWDHRLASVSGKFSAPGTGFAGDKVCVV